MKKISVVTLMILILGLFALTIYEALHVFGTARQHKYELPNEDVNIIFNLDNADVATIKSKKILELDGWAFIRDVDAYNQKIYITLVSELNNYIFDVEQKKRNDVASIFNNFDKHLDQSGFSTKFQMDNVKNGIYKIGIFIKNGDQSELAFTDLSVSRTEGNVEISQTKSELIDTRIIKNAESKVVANLEEVSFNDDTFKIKGWAFLQDEDITDDTKIVLLLKSAGETLAFNTQRQLREDVTDYYEGKLDVDRSGFISRVNKNILKDETYKVGVYVSNSKGSGIFWSNESIGE